MEISASEAFGLKVIGRATHGGKRWVVFDDGAYRHVVSECHFTSCGSPRCDTDGERCADAYSHWCGRGEWASDEVAAEVAAICDLTHVHSAVSGGCGRVEAKEVSDG
jgi:hypothetical protein